MSVKDKIDGAPVQTFKPRGRTNRDSRYQPANPDYRAPRLKMVDPLALHGQPVPERRWIVPDWIPHGSVTQIGGDGGVGKSLVAMQLMTSVATGKAWLGQAVTACRTLAVFCEDDRAELHRRQAAINEHYGIGFDELENMTWISRVGEDAILMEFDRDHGSPTEFYQSLHNEAQDFGAQLIILDALHDLFAGNENVRGQARQFINLLRALAMDCDGAVVFTAHPSLSGLSSGSGTSGSTAWSNAVRSRLYLSRPKPDEDGAEIDDNERILSRLKANYAGAGDQLRLRWEHGVLKAEQTDTTIFGAIDKRKAETAFLEALDKIEEQGRHVSDYPTSANYAPKIMVAMSQCNGFRRRDLEKAMRRLFDTCEIRIASYGRPGSPSKKIARRATPVSH